MKKLFLASLIILSGLFCSAQVKSYVNGSVSYYNGAGTFSQQAMPTVEVGVTLKSTSVGIANGYTAFSNGNFYSELRVSPTLWEKGRFSVSGSLGAGYVYTPKQLLTEYGGGVGYSLSNMFSVGLFAGKYNFSGKTTSAAATFTGAGVTCSF